MCVDNRGELQVGDWKFHLPAWIALAAVTPCVCGALPSWSDVYPSLTYCDDCETHWLNAKRWCLWQTQRGNDAD